MLQSLPCCKMSVPSLHAHLIKAVALLFSAKSCAYIPLALFWKPSSSVWEWHGTLKPLMDRRVHRRWERLMAALMAHP